MQYIIILTEVRVVGNVGRGYITVKKTWVKRSNLLSLELSQLSFATQIYTQPAQHACLAHSTNPTLHFKQKCHDQVLPKLTKLSSRLLFAHVLSVKVMIAFFNNHMRYTNHNREVQMNHCAPLRLPGAHSGRGNGLLSMLANVVN